MISATARAWLCAPAVILLAACSLLSGLLFRSLDEGEGSVEPICWEQTEGGGLSAAGRPAGREGRGLVCRGVPRAPRLDVPRGPSAPTILDRVDSIGRCHRAGRTAPSPGFDPPAGPCASLRATIPTQQIR